MEPTEALKSKLLRDLLYGALGSEALVPVGSRTIPGAAKPESDWDILITRPHHSLQLRDLTNRLLNAGWTLDDSSEYQTGGSFAQFESWKCRMEDKTVNLIMADAAFKVKFAVANEVCKVLKLVRRDDRLVVFKAILYNALPPGPDLLDLP